jgi:hypothetical protein
VVVFVACVAGDQCAGERRLRPVVATVVVNACVVAGMSSKLGRRNRNRNRRSIHRIVGVVAAERPRWATWDVAVRLVLVGIVGIVADNPFILV